MRWLSGGTTIPWRVLQAGDRAHRIGQKKAVLVLVLVAAGTIEEAILDRAQQKRDIDAKVIQVGHTPTPCWCLFRLLPLWSFIACTPLQDASGRDCNSVAAQEPAALQEISEGQSTIGSSVFHVAV